MSAMMGSLLQQGAGQGRGEGKSRDERRLHGVVGVGLAVPDGSNGAVGRIELVSPAPALVVDEVSRGVIPPGAVALLVAENGCRRGRLREYPVQPVAHHRRAVPVD